MSRAFNSSDGLTRIRVEVAEDFVALDEFTRPHDWKQTGKRWRDTGAGVTIPRDLLKSVVEAMLGCGGPGESVNGLQLYEIAKQSPACTPADPASWNHPLMQHELRKAVETVLTSKYVVNAPPPEWMRRLAKLIDAARTLAEFARDTEIQTPASKSHDAK